MQTTGYETAEMIAVIYRASRETKMKTSVEMESCNTW